MTRPIEIAPTGPVSTLGVRFRPGGARGLLPPLDVFAGAFPTPREIWGSEAGSIEDEVANAPDLRSRRAILERFLEKRRARARASALGARLSAAVGLVLASRGRASVAAIARRVGCSPRQLERAFAAGVGVTPKELSRIARFQNVLRLSGRNPAAGWADLAARCGYADQAHLVREFKTLSGATPASREATAGALARYFIDPARLDALLSPAPVAFVQDAGTNDRVDSAPRRTSCSMLFSRLAFALASAPAAATTPDVATLSWMSGRWAGSQGGTEMEEIWTAPRGGTLLGVHRDVKDGRTVSFEFLRIEAVPEGLTYFASPQGRPATPFRAVENAKGRVVFENREHDFPTRILYWLGGDGTLHARIEGTLRGQAASEEWAWSRQP